MAVARTGVAGDDTDFDFIERLAANDNLPDAIAALQELNRNFRARAWPPPFDLTRHQLQLGDARAMSWVPDDSIDLVVTSPPYWNLKQYETNKAQLGEMADYEAFLTELDRVWVECERVLVPGGRICCVVGDVCLSRKAAGRHYVMPLHADIQVRARRLGLDCLTPILWNKIANGVTEAEGNGAGFYGKPYQPGAVVKNDVEYILFLRKPGGYRSPSGIAKMLSMLSREEMRDWLRSVWADVRGTSTRDGHPAPYPVEIAERLIKLFSFAGDTVLDPFAGTGTTSVAAMRTGRNSIAVEIEPRYVKLAEQRLQAEAAQRPLFGAQTAVLSVSRRRATAGRRTDARTMRTSRKVPSQSAERKEVRAKA